MIIKCNNCGLYRLEKEPTPCPDCDPVHVERATCGNGCDHPAVVVTAPIGYVFCLPCYEGFLLGQNYPDETVDIRDMRRE